MSWPITWRGEWPGQDQARVGDLYWARPDCCHPREGRPTHAYGKVLSRHFDKAARRPLMLVLPTGYHLVVDCAYWSPQDPNPGRDGWVVTLAGELVVGAQPLLTLSPSVNIVGSYHGWVGCNGVPPGVMSQDLDGRRFP